MEIYDDNLQLYPYSYNEANDVYLVRGILSYEADFFPRTMSYIPNDLITTLMNDYQTNHNHEEELRLQISYSTNKYYAIVDFRGREFSNAEIIKIANSYQNAKSEDKGPRKKFNIHNRKVDKV